ISSEPLRVISLSPSITEILFSLNLGSRVIAVDSFSNYPPEVIELKDKGVIQDIGGFWSPDLEKIVALAPDVIIADSDAHMKFKDKFEELGLNVVFIRGGAAVTVEDILLDIMLVAKVFNVEDNGAKLIQNISEQLITIEEKVKEASKVKTLVLLGPPSLGLWTVGSGKFLNDIIHRAGGINIAEKYYGWIQLSLEEVISADPEVIIVLVMGTTEDAKAVINEIVNSELSETSAVKNGRVYVLIGEADDIVSRPGPRVAKATLLLAKIIHPDIFGEPLLTAVTFLVFILSLSVGSVHISFADVLLVILSKLGMVNYNPGSLGKVVLGIRFSRTMATILVGSSLAVSGVGALIALFVTMTISELLGGTPLSLILAGIAVSAMFAGVSQLLAFIVQFKLNMPFLMLLLGSFSNIVLTHVFIVSISFTVGFIIALTISKRLNALIFGDEHAFQLGYNPKVLRYIAILTTSFLTGVAVSVSGLIGFIGLVVPHISRLIVGNDHRVLIPSSALLGGSLLCFSDVIVRCLSSNLGFGELPVGALMSVVGAPFFIYLLLKKMRG
ncbi:MAG: hypothetical protein B6U75_02040, partial [Desulfurococcales archaeon ex4484_217_1]